MYRAFALAIQALLDSILPRKERVVRLETYGPEDIPLSPASLEAYGVEIVALTQYRFRAVEDLIRALKYDKSGTAARLLAGALAEYMREEIATVGAFSAKPVVLVPVPLHPSRELERGFNQIARVLEHLPYEFRDGSLASVAPEALVRIRATPQQTRLSRHERLTNVKDAFALNEGAAGRAVRGAHVVLIDDVTTTGATLAAAAKPLRGESVTLLALARA